MKRTLLFHELIILLILICALSPSFVVLGAGIVASAFDCPVNEGFTQPCMAYGKDISGTLYNTSALGWYSLITIPLGGVVLVLYILGAVALAVLKPGR